MQYTIDAKNKRLGRIATEVAVILQGKKDPKYNPRLPGSDSVVITNASRISVSGNKSKQKIYYRHTGYLGNLKETTYEKMFAKSPEKVITKAVYNMLPKNRLRAPRLKRLKIEL
jgi:large subunit ribosomal protein L13